MSDLCSDHMLKGLGLETMALALASKVQALAFRFCHWLHHCYRPL